MSPKTPAADRPENPQDEATTQAPTEATATEPAATTTPLEDTMSDTIAPPAEAASPVVAEERRVRVGTIVWGLVLAAIGAGLLASALGVVFDVELAFIVLVAAAGVLLLVGSLASSRRRRG